MLHAPVSDKQTKPESIRSEVEQDSEGLRQKQTGWGDRSGLGAMSQAYGNQAALRMLRSQRQESPIPSSVQGGILQRKCACSDTASVGCTCTLCRANQELSLQRKLNVNEPDDRYEQEADRVADRVTAMPSISVQSQGKVEGEKELLQRGSIPQPTPLTLDEASSERLSHVFDIRGSIGHPLDAETRDYMEPRFGRRFNNVKVHHDSVANAVAHSINAQAFTHKQNIYFASGSYNPKSESGRRLLAHELTHTVQQVNSHSSAIQRQQDQEEIPQGERLATMRSPTPPPASSLPQTSERIEDRPPTISALPIDQWRDVTIIDFPPVPDLVPRYSLPDAPLWEGDTGRVNFLRIPIEFGSFDAGGALRASVVLRGGVGPVQLTNVRAAFSQEQAQLLRTPLPQLTLLPPFVILPSSRFRNFHPARSHPHGRELREFAVEAELIIPAELRLEITAGGELEAAATALGFDIATIGGGITITAFAGASNIFRGQGQFQYRDGHLNIDHRLFNELIFELGYELEAFLEISLLGFEKRYDWLLAQDVGFSRSWETDTGLGILTDDNGSRRIARRIDLRGLPNYLRQFNQIIDNLTTSDQTTLNDESLEPTGTGSELCLPRYAVLEGADPRRHRRPETVVDESNPYSIDGASIDGALPYLVRHHRINDAGTSFADFQSKNVAVGKVWIDGSYLYIPKTNVPGGEQHSEDLIAAEMQSLRRRGRPILTQLFSERRPCPRCMQQIRRDYSTGGAIETRHASIFYSVPYPERDLNTTRANELRSSYCLEPPPRRRIRVP